MNVLLYDVVFSVWSKKEVPSRDVRNSKSGNITSLRENGNNVTTLEQMEVPNGTRSGVRKSKQK